MFRAGIRSHTPESSVTGWVYTVFAAPLGFLVGVIWILRFSPTLTIADLRSFFLDNPANLVIFIGLPVLAARTGSWIARNKLKKSSRGIAAAFLTGTVFSIFFLGYIISTFILDGYTITPSVMRHIIGDRVFLVATGAGFLTSGIGALWLAMLYKLYELIVSAKNRLLGRTG
ncbi:MAG: hypothetical protein AB7H77_03195 [Bdellovibrionales bacterium]